MHSKDLTHLDVGLDPAHDPRTKEGILPVPDLLLEEMLEVGLNPDEMSEEAYLRARREFVAGHLNSLGEMIRKAREYNTHLQEKDAAIRTLASQNS